MITVEWIKDFLGVCLHDTDVVEQRLRVVARMLSTIACIDILSLLDLSENVMNSGEHFQSQQIVHAVSGLYRMMREVISFNEHTQNHHR